MLNRRLTVSLALVLVFMCVNILEAAGGLVFYLPLNEGSGDPTDTSANPTDVVIKGQLEWVDGRFGKALKFDGNAANFVEAAHSDKLEGMQALTIMVWAKPEAPDANARGLVSKRVASSDSDVYNLFSWTEVKIWARTNHTGDVTSQTVLADDTWYHIAYVFDGGGATNEKAKLYINGALEAAGDHPASAVEAHGASLFIGTLNEAYAQNWKGVLDDVSIWDIALSGAEIKGYADGTLTAVKPQNKLSATWGEIKSGAGL
ncbi:LamG domain-containing protein [Candidatus Poribacteria bacterium]